MIDKLVAKFGDLSVLIKADLEELDTVEGVGQARARSIREGLKRFKETNVVERTV
ncbi:MAG: helix-hairpin-helix domain-containing protein [Terriglobia bacterium]